MTAEPVPHPEPFDAPTDNEFFEEDEPADNLARIFKNSRRSKTYLPFPDSREPAQPRGRISITVNLPHPSAGFYATESIECDEATVVDQLRRLTQRTINRLTVGDTVPEYAPRDRT